LLLSASPHIPPRAISTNTPTRRRVVITGIGPIASCGIGRDAFWRSIREGRSGITRQSVFSVEGCRAFSIAEVASWDPTRFFPPHRLKRLDRYAQFSVGSALLALEDAQINWSRERPNPRIGVSFGTALGGISCAEKDHALFLKKGPRGVNPTLALQVFGGSAHSNIAIECGLRGVGTTNSNSCASGVVSVGEAMRYIRDGWVDAMVAGGAEAPLSPLTFSSFDFIKTMSRWDGDPIQHACRPFDRERDGFTMGEGGCSLVLEELGHATSRGASIYAEVCGYALNNDAYHMTSPHPDGQSVTNCMLAALRDAQLPPDAIGYINCHASSTQLNDAGEVACIKRAFGSHAEKLAISGTKPFTGHPLGATGAMEAAICALALREQWLPPTMHYRTPDPACDLDIVPNKGRDSVFEYAMNNAFGFGGINSSLILRRWGS
jgi:3-oxoacyl-[acyl-carrier-protein] synthase II